MKRGTIGLKIMVGLILGAILLYIYFGFVIPKMKSSISVFSLVTAECKDPAFYYDVVSHSPDNSVKYYEEYVKCEEVDKLRAWRDLDLKPQGALTLVQGYLNNGDYYFVKDDLGPILSGKYKFKGNFLEQYDNLMSLYGELYDNWGFEADLSHDSSVKNCKDRWGDNRMKSGEVKTAIGQKMNYVAKCPGAEFDPIDEICQIWFKVGDKNTASTKPIVPGEKILVPSGVNKEDGKPYNYVFLYEGFAGSTIFYRILIE